MTFRSFQGLAGSLAVALVFAGCGSDAAPPQPLNLMANVKAPGKEFASGDWEKLANPSGKAFLEQNQKMQDYVKNYIEALTAAKQKITTKESDAYTDLSKQGNQAT